jgi:hypothetical protein
MLISFKPPDPLIDRKELSVLQNRFDGRSRGLISRDQSLITPR